MSAEERRWQRHVELKAAMNSRQPLADHPHVDPGDGRPQCPVCGKFVWPAIHSCKGIRVAPVDPNAKEWR